MVTHQHAIFPLMLAIVAFGCGDKSPANGAGGAGAGSTTSSTTSGMGGSGGPSSTTSGMGGSGGPSSTTSGMGGSGGSSSTTSTGNCSGTASSSTGAGGSVDSCAAGAPGSLCWGKKFGKGNLSPAAIATDSSGNILVTGYFSGTVDFGNGLLATTSADDFDMYVAKLDPSGNGIWSKRFGDTHFQTGRGIGVDPTGDVVVLAAFDGVIDFCGGPLVANGNDSLDIALVKLDGNGNFKWSKSFGDDDLQQPEGLAVDNSGNIILDGQSWGTVNFGGDPLTSTSDHGALIVAKFDPAGEHLWSKIFQNTGNSYLPYLWRVAVDGQGNVVFAGAFEGSIKFGPAPLVSAGNRDVFVVRLNADGTLAWAKRYGDGLNQEGTSAVADSNGNVFVTGAFHGSLNFGNGPIISTGIGDIFLAKLDPSGNAVWSKRFGDVTSKNLSHTGDEVAVDGAGNSIISGSLLGNADFGGGFHVGGMNGDAYPYVAKFDAAGTYAWSYVGDHSATAQSVGADPNGNVIIAGSFSSPLFFAGASLSTPDKQNTIYALKLTP
jgi:hypothetical protein